MCFTLEYIILFHTIILIYGNKLLTIIQSPSDVYGLLNQQVSLRCESNDNDDNISWIKDDRIIQSDSKFLVFQLNLESEGYYSCNISNKYGWIMTDKALVRIAYLQQFPDQNITEQFASPGATVLMQCPSIEGLPRPSIEWKANHSLSDSRFKIGGGQDLRIDMVQRSDSGFYWCRAKNLAFTRFSSPIRLVIIQKPIFLLLPKHFSVMQGSSILFPCVVVGELPLLVHWYKLSSSSNDPSLARASIASNCSLFLNNVRLHHSGAYIARAINRAGITEIVFKLSVISLPSFTITPENAHASLGQSILLPCSASGTPTPRLFWYHDNDYLMSDTDSVGSNSRVVIFDNGTLFISSVRSRDAGSYYCYAASFVGLSRTHCILSVTIPANMFAPVIVSPPHNVTAVEGSTSVLTCRTIESSQTTITWYKQSLRIIALNAPRGRHYLLKNGDLKISNCRIQDSASYTCRASIGSLYSEKSAQLTVKSYAEVGNDISLVSHKEALGSRAVNISVEFIGDTYLLVKWDVGQSRHTQLFRVEVAAQFVSNWVEVTSTTETRVLVSNLRPDTGYKILIRSKGTVSVLPEVVYTLGRPTIAVDSTFVDFHKALQDIQILSVKVTSVSSSQLHISWKVRGSSILRSVSGFIIKTEPVSMKRCQLMTQKLGQTLFSCLHNDDFVDVDDIINKYDDKDFTSTLKVQKFVVQRSVDRERPKSSAIIGGLKPFVCYEVEIETYIDHIKAGRISGRDSSTKTALTYDDLPAKSPTIRKYYWVDNITFSVSWDKLDTHHSNGPITGYIIQIIDLADKSLQTFKVSVAIHEYKVRIQAPEHRHLLYVSANSCRGPGPRSSPILINKDSGDPYYGHKSMISIPWTIAIAVGASLCAISLILTLIWIFICKRSRASRRHAKLGQIPLVSSTDKEMNASFSKKIKGDKTLNNYDTLLPNLKTSSDGFSSEHCPSSGTTTIPRFACGSEDHKSLQSTDGTCSDSLAYASSSIIYKGCQHYNQPGINMFPPNFYGLYIDNLNDQRNIGFGPTDPTQILNPLIPPPPLYPPPPAPKNQRHYPDNAPETSCGSHNNTQSSGSASACGSSNKSNKTRKSRTPQSVNQSLHSSSSSKSQKNAHKTSQSNRSHCQTNSSPSIAGDYKKSNSHSNSTNSSQKTGALAFVPTSNPAMLLYECAHDDPSELILTSELSDTDTAPGDLEADEKARDTDSLRVMYKLPLKRPPSPDYSTDSSYPYSMANHYSSAEPTLPNYPGNLPTKF